MTFTSVGRAWDKQCNIKWFHWRCLAMCLYFISILIQHLDGGSRRDPNM